MPKQPIFPKEFIQTMTWQESFDLAKAAWINAERLHYAAIALYEKDYFEQAYNNLFIACEEYYKGKTFDAIANVKKKGKGLNDEVLEEFVDKAGDHKWKFREAFFDAEMNIPNVTLKVEEGFDDTEIQESLHKEMQETFDYLNNLNPYDKKNNSLYVGYNKTKESLTIPQKEIEKEMVNRFFKICFYIQMDCRVDIKSNIPFGEVSGFLKWSGNDFLDLVKK